MITLKIKFQKSFQYKCVIVFGLVALVNENKEKRVMLDGLLNKYFGEMKQGSFGLTI